MVVGKVRKHMYSKHGSRVMCNSRMQEDKPGEGRTMQEELPRGVSFTVPYFSYHTHHNA